ncbi:MAG TPA: 4-(cytidine 5'-diphospho)-2-C-methyl-D-erythritol kinase [Ilumatobacteraceae bacterium]
MTVVVAAPAKLTLSLHIVGVRADGYHLIDAEMTTLDFGDTLTIDPNGSGLTCAGPYASGVPLDRSNLVAKALAMVGADVAVHIDKRIPHGGGLGGGSADAAAILRWAGSADLARAASLGADVPFCVAGGRARVRGIGEIVDPLPLLERELTLIIPPLSCSTPAVYGAWDALGGPRHATNDLTSAALLVEPRLHEWQARIRAAAGCEPVLAGSGATWFVDGHHPGLADALPEADIVLTRTAG